MTGKDILIATFACSIGEITDRDIAWRLVATGKKPRADERAQCYVEQSVMVRRPPFDDACTVGLEGVK